MEINNLCDILNQIGFKVCKESLNKESQIIDLSLKQGPLLCSIVELDGNLQIYFMFHLNIYAAYSLSDLTILNLFSELDKFFDNESYFYLKDTLVRDAKIDIIIK